MKWIRTHESRLHDLRFATLSAEAERAYNRMYILAGVLEADGLFIQDGRQLTPEEIAYRVRLDAATLKKTLNELQRARLVHVNGKGPQIVDFKTEQIDLRIKRQSDLERQHKHRAVTPPSQTVTRDNGASQSVTHGHTPKTKTKTETQTKTQIKTRVLLLLSADARERIQDEHPGWVDEAVTIADLRGGVDGDPARYAAGILRNWLTEGRQARPTRSALPARGKSRQAKPTRKKLEGDALQAAREQAAKELLK